MLVLVAVSSHDISTHFSHCKEAQRLVLSLPDENEGKEQEGSIVPCSGDDRDLFIDTVLSLDSPHDLVFGSQHLTPQQTDMCKRMYYQFKFPLSVKELSLHPIAISPKTTFISVGAKNPKIHFLISVAVHGNEHCGVTAVNQLFQEGWFEKDNVFLSSIRVTILLGNPGAFVAKKRFLEENLNRVMSEDIFDNATSYERKLARRLASAIDKSDVYLDIHSTSSDSVPFALPAKNNKSEELALLLPCHYSIKNLAHLTDPKATSVEYAYRRDKTAVCVECGQHDNPNAVEVAKQVIKTMILSQCSKFGLSSSAQQTETTTSPSIELITNRTCCAVDQSVPSTHQNVAVPTSSSMSLSQQELLLTELDCRGCAIVRKGFRFLRPFKAFEYIGYDEPIALDEEQGIVKCPFKEGAVIIMPTSLPILGEEAFFWGVKKTTSSANKGSSRTTEYTFISGSTTTTNNNNDTNTTSSSNNNNNGSTRNLSRSKTIAIPEKTSPSSTSPTRSTSPPSTTPFPPTMSCSPTNLSSSSLHMVGESF